MASISHDFSESSAKAVAKALNDEPHKPELIGWVEKRLKEAQKAKDSKNKTNDSKPTSPQSRFLTLNL